MNGTAINKTDFIFELSAKTTENMRQFDLVFSTRKTIFQPRMTRIYTNDSYSY